MDNIKKTLDNYRENPKDDAWGRIESQLDALAAKRRAKKVSAIAVSAILIAALATIFSINIAKKTDKKAEAEKAATVAEASVSPATKEEIAVEKDALAEEKEVEVTVAVEKKATAEKAIQPEQIENTNSTEEKESAGNTNIEQIVLPANSTLARQLKSDPVLKNMNGDELVYTPPVRLQIPNLFTPNGDGTNDKFVIEGLENYDKKSLTVSDRNGRVVFHSENYRNTWAGENCNDGVYNYVFIFSYNGIESTASGKVRILRN